MDAAAARGLLPALRRLVRPLDERVGDVAARQAHAAWIIGLRWIALMAVAVVVAVATDLDGRLAPEAAPRLWGGVAALLLATVAWTLLGARRGASATALAAAIGGDVLLIGWLVHAAGGMANPFAGIFAFHGILAAVVLPRRGGLAAGAIAAFVLGLTAVEAGGALPPLPLGALGADAATIAGGGVAVALLVLGGALLAGAVASSLHHERDRLEAASDRLRVERETLQSIVDCMGDAVVFADRDGRIALRNRAAQALWAERPPAGSLRVCHSDATWARLLAKLADPAEKEPHPTLVVGGRSYEASYARVREPDGRLSGVVMVARDVTERLAAQAWRMREERMAVVGKLAAGVAHEINNPLGAIALFARHALKALPAGHPLVENLETIGRNADACKRVVKDLLGYARQRPPEHRTLALREALDDAARTLRAPADRAGVEVRVEAEEISARADGDQLHQVLVNLGLNAIEAMPAGGTLRLAGAAAPGGVRLEIHDSGVGIPAAERERIFTAFYTTKPEGTGLGLAVVRDLVDAHGGRVEVASEPGRGTTFTVFLPQEAA
jgi:signal transduction histidine kinase